MNTPRLKFTLLWCLLLIGTFLSFTRGRSVVSAPGDTIGITGADFSRTVQPADSLPLRDSLNTVSDRIIVEIADRMRVEALSYPLGMLGDVTAPNVVNLQVIVNAPNRSATITWSTDEFAKTLLQYGRQPGSYTQSITDTLYAKQHSVLIDKLSIGTYYFIIRSSDRDNNQATTSESSFIVADAPTPIPTLPAGLQLRSVEPQEGLISQPTALTVSGGGFAGSLSVRLQRGNIQHSLTSVTILNAVQLQASVAANLPTGLYDLVVQNSTGQRAVLPNAFTLLAAAPVIRAVRPNQGVDDLPNDIVIDGLNFSLNATVKVGETTLTTQRVNGTQLVATVPAGLAVGSYPVIVTNATGEQARLENGYTVYGSSSNNDLFAYDYELWVNPTAPRAGEPVHIGLFIHRQGGRTVLQNVRARFVLESQAVAPLGDGLIPFLDPAKGVDSTQPLTVTFPKAGSVTLFAVLDPQNEVAEGTLGEANNVISRTLTVAAAAPDRTPPVVDDIVVNNGAQQSAVRDVRVAIRASDPPPNASTVRSVSVIEYVFNLGANQWVPQQQSEWLPFDGSQASYPWRLQPTTGLHYLQVRALDKADNISVGNARTEISYIPASDQVTRNQTRIYRQSVGSSQQLEVRVEIISGDPDLYVWSSNPAQSAFVSNKEGAVEERVVIPASHIVSGTYQIEVFGFANSEYRLHIVTEGQATEPAPIVNPIKPAHSSPVIPVSSKPDERQGVPPSPPPVEEVGGVIYLPMVRR